MASEITNRFGVVLREQRKTHILQATSYTKLWYLNRPWFEHSLQFTPMLVTCLIDFQLTCPAHWIKKSFYKDRNIGGVYQS